MIGHKIQYMVISAKYYAIGWQIIYIFTKTQYEMLIWTEVLQETHRKIKKTEYVRVEAFNKTVYTFLKYSILGTIYIFFWKGQKKMFLVEKHLFFRTVDLENEWLTGIPSFI